jgi:hypothetical protein
MKEMMPGSEGAGFFCKNGVKNTPQKHWFLGILLAGTKNISYLCNMKNTERERKKIESINH